MVTDQQMTVNCNSVLVMYFKIVFTSIVLYQYDAKRKVGHLHLTIK